MSQASQTRFMKLNGYTLSVTSRDHGDNPHILEELTYRTVKAWLWLAGLIEKGKYVLDTEVGSVEQRYATENNQPIPDSFVGDSRVTVWCHWKSNRAMDFHLNSDDIPQVALQTWVTQETAHARLKMEYPEDAPQTAPSASNSSAQAHTGSQVPATTRASNPEPPVSDNIVIATRAPNPNNKDYADGQLVEFKINKIVLGTHPNSGSVIYSLWGDLGKKYALKTVYVMASNGTDKSYDYQTAAPVLEPLSLSIPGKMQAEGNWRLICKAVNSGEKQYINIISLSNAV